MPQHLEPGPRADVSEQSAGNLALAVLLILFGAAMRLVEHPWNFTPMWAIALFAGAHLRNRGLAFAIPVAALFLSDTLLQLLHPERGFYTAMVFTYVGFAGVVVCGMLTRLAPRSWAAYVAALVLAWLGGSVFFFLVSNFGYWLTFPDFPKTVAGLMQCYVAGLPFYRQQLLGDLIYVPLLFGTYHLAGFAVPALAPARAGK